MRVSEYVVIWRDAKSGELSIEYIQALNAKQAVEFLLDSDEDITVLTVARVCKNWK